MKARKITAVHLERLIPMISTNPDLTKINQFVVSEHYFGATDGHRLLAMAKNEKTWSKEDAPRFGVPQPVVKQALALANAFDRTSKISFSGDDCRVQVGGWGFEWEKTKETIDIAVVLGKLSNSSEGRNLAPLQGIYLAELAKLTPRKSGLSPGVRILSSGQKEPVFFRWKADDLEWVYVVMPLRKE